MAVTQTNHPQHTIHHEMSENFAIAQSIILLALSVERYAALFTNYSPFVRRPLYFCVVSTLPYFCALLAFDYQILVTQMSPETANIVR